MFTGAPLTTPGTRGSCTAKCRRAAAHRGAPLTPAGSRSRGEKGGVASLNECSTTRCHFLRYAFMRSRRTRSSTQRAPRSSRARLPPSRNGSCSRRRRSTPRHSAPPLVPPFALRARLPPEPVSSQPPRPPRPPRRREPLGRAMVRGHVLPEGLGTQVPFPGGAVFDARQHDREGEVKALLFPKDLNYQESKEMHEQYIRTHGRYDPGEQRTRGYDWDGIGLNPAETVFGKKAATDPRAFPSCRERHAAPPASVVPARSARSLPPPPILRSAPSQARCTANAPLLTQLGRKLRSTRTLIRRSSQRRSSARGSQPSSAQSRGSFGQTACLRCAAAAASGAIRRPAA